MGIKLKAVWLVGPAPGTLWVTVAGRLRPAGTPTGRRTTAPRVRPTGHVARNLMPMGGCPRAAPLADERKGRGEAAG
jgi:hypothetical protein